MSYDSVSEFPKYAVRNASPHARGFEAHTPEENDTLENAIALRGLAGIALGLFEIAMPKKVMDLDELDQKSETAVRIAGRTNL